MDQFITLRDPWGILWDSFKCPHSTPILNCSRSSTRQGQFAKDYYYFGSEDSEGFKRWRIVKESLAVIDVVCVGV